MKINWFSAELAHESFPLRSPASAQGTQSPVLGQLGGRAKPSRPAERRPFDTRGPDQAPSLVHLPRVPKEFNVARHLAFRGETPSPLRINSVAEWTRVHRQHYYANKTEINEDKMDYLRQ